MKALGKDSIASFVQVALTIAWILLWVALGLLAITALAYCAILGLGSAGVLDPAIFLGAKDGGIRIETDQGTLVVYDNLSAAWPVFVPALLIGAVAVGGGLIIVDRLRRLFASFTSGEPFQRENATHLRVIWITMLAIEGARFVLMGALATVFAAVGAPNNVDPDFNISVDFSTWMSIAILIVLAEVFREGARMKEEQELTI
ncbi:MAG: DUF2975 domain-containing protein [Terricaulis sp.]